MNKNLSELIACHRKIMGMSMDEFAAECNVSKSLICRLEAGNRGANLSLKSGIGLSRAMGLTCEELYLYVDSGKDNG